MKYLISNIESLNNVQISNFKFQILEFRYSDLDIEATGRSA